MLINPENQNKLKKLTPRKISFPVALITSKSLIDQSWILKYSLCIAILPSK
jgi:hypothetical protein